MKNTFFDSMIIVGGGKTQRASEIIDNPAKDKDYYKIPPYERTKAMVYATGNKWEIEKFHATHD